MENTKKHLVLDFEEAINTLTHGFGFLLSVAGLITLIAMSFLTGNISHIISCVIYGSTLTVLYAASTLLHSSHAIGKPSRKYEIFDHCAIYLLIAGTYTPFTLVALKGWLGYSMFTVVWSIAVLGILYKIFYFGKDGVLSVLSYIGMGWIAVFAISQIFEKVGFNGFALLLAGGLFYTIGAVFYLWRKLPYNHAIWHIFVMGGSISHYMAVTLYVLPLK